MFVHMPKLTHLIGSEQAAKILRVTRSTFNRRVSAGKVPIAFEMDGTTGARLFDLEEIERLAGESHEEAS